jgi:uncharacterized membrane protein YqjE
MNDSHNGLFASVKRMADLALATMHTRIELFAVEVQEEKCRFVQAVLLTAGAIALGVSALALATIALVVLFWDHGRIAILCGLSGLFILGAGLMFRSLRKCLSSGPGFKGTLGELEKDRTCLLPKN